MKKEIRFHDVLHEESENPDFRKGYEKIPDNTHPVPVYSVDETESEEEDSCIPNAETLEAMKEAEQTLREIKAGTYKGKIYKTVDEMFKDLGLDD